MVQAGFLDGTEPAWQLALGSPRTVLADWVVARDNPYFARAAVNRVWSLFFGTGLVDPVDDLDDENPPSHPELLDELADGVRRASVRLQVPDPRPHREPGLPV